MRLFKATYKDREGVSRESAKWYLEFRDHNETVRRFPLCTDRKASEAIARQVERLLNLKVSGAEPDAELLRWFTEMDADLWENLTKIGLLDDSRSQSRRTLTEHLTDWKQALQAKGSTEDHVLDTHARVHNALVARCGFVHYRDIDHDVLRTHLTKRREGNEISAQTSNYILRDCKGFCRWMVREGRATRNALDCLQPLSDKAVKQDARHPRRVEPPEVVAHLIATAAKGPDRLGMTGPERALLYRLAVETGLRSGELASLTRKDFELDAKVPRVVLQDGKTKNGKDAYVPLLPDTVELLRVHLADMLPMATVFAMPQKSRVIHMFKADLAAAGITYKDVAGRFFDFHCLRHCTATYLAEQGIHPKVVQDVMRHAVLNTTLRYFKATVIAKRAEALASMPDLGKGVARVVKQATTNETDAGASQNPNEQQAERQDKRTNPISPYAAVAQLVEQRIFNP